jgi:hypothetical protein
VRPDSYGITPTVSTSTVSFTLGEPRNVVIQVNHGVFDCLHLLARPLETDRPAVDDPNVIYFGPGLHTTVGGTLTVGSGKTVYLDGGAVLTSRVVFKDVQNERLAGRGVIWAAPGGGATVEGSTNISIGGVTMLNPGGRCTTRPPREELKRCVHPIVAKLALRRQTLHRRRCRAVRPYCWRGLEAPVAALLSVCAEQGRTRRGSLGSAGGRPSVEWWRGSRTAPWGGRRVRGRR